MQVRSIQIGRAEHTPAKSGRTGHFKKPITGPVAVGPLGLANDVICDLQNHGGPDQAVYLFGEADRQWWAKQLQRDLAPGFFGENLLISNLQSADLVIGDIIEIGSALLQITSPRIPCLTYAAHIGSPLAIRDFFAAERPGAYGRVLREGTVSAGDTVVLQSYEGERISVVDSMREYRGNYSDLDFLKRCLDVPAHYKLHAVARQRLGIQP